MLDRVLSLEPALRAEGLKAVSSADCQGAAALPGPLVLHGLAALAGMVLEEDGRAAPVLEAVERAAFLRAARPGEVITYRVEVEEAGPEGVLLRAEASVGQEKLVEARLRWRPGDGEARGALEGSSREHRRALLSGRDPTILRL